MNALLLSEHYFPKIGGTVSYVEHTSTILSRKLDKVYLLAPSVGAINKIEEEQHKTSPLIILRLGVKESGQLKFDAEERNVYCRYIRDHATELVDKYELNVVHILIGLFIAEYLNTNELHKKGVKTVHTIHNIPPQECSVSWKGDSLAHYYKDLVRKEGVRIVNKRRILKNQFDNYVVPSEEVANNLKKYLGNAQIKAIGHGGTKNAVSSETKLSNPIRLLTVGGFVPHKNQHLIPEIALHLSKNGIEFQWDVVGPIRNKRYYQYFLNLIDKNKLREQVRVSHNLPERDLEELYQSANLYLQLSSEEGFCMTVLDAILYRLPVIATPVGAIPEMLEMVDGVLIDIKDSNRDNIILHYVKIIDQLKPVEEKYNTFLKKYTWNNAVDHLIKVYHE